MQWSTVFFLVYFGLYLIEEIRDAKPDWRMVRFFLWNAINRLGIAVVFTLLYVWETYEPVALIAVGAESAEEMRLP